MTPLSQCLLTMVGERIADEVEKVAAGRQSNCELAAVEVVKMVVSALTSPAPSEAPGGGGWRDISTAPKDGTRILVWREPVVPGAAYFDVTGWPNNWTGLWPTAYMHYADGHEPTHWMPLPAPPADEPLSGAVEAVEPREMRVNLPLLYEALSDPTRDQDLIAQLAFRAANELKAYRAAALSGAGEEER